MRSVLLAALTTFLFLAGSAAAQQETATPAAPVEGYRLGAGDNLVITVFGHPDLTGEFQVDGSGNVSFPLVGGVSLGGKTIPEAQDVIADALQPDYLKNPRVSIQVLNYRPFYIIGEVAQPGSYAYVNGMTVLEAVAIAGGFTYRAKESEVTIIRANDPSRRKVPANPETAILPGDVIQVPERFF